MSAELRIAFHNFFTNLIIFLVLFKVIEASMHQLPLRLRTRARAGNLGTRDPFILAPLSSSIDAYQPLREKESKYLTTRFYPFNVMLGTILSTGI
jgi:hypothetical protein